VDECSIDDMLQGHRGPATGLSNLSFLNLEPSEEGIPSYCLKKSHVSIVICGSDNVQWVGYAFTNSADNKDDDESDGSETDGTEDEDEDEDEVKFQRDLFASVDSDSVIDANMPTYDAREYWLCVIHLRLDFIVKKWAHTVLKIEQRVRDHVG
jgi:hypothetical protein